MDALRQFWSEHLTVTRRGLLKLGVSGVPFVFLRQAWGADSSAPELAKALAQLKPYLTRQADFNDVSRGKPIPHKLTEERRREVGLTRETWRLEVLADPEHPAKIRQPLTKADQTAIDFRGLLELGERHAVRFPKVMTCLNIGCPLGMGIWEGVPLREVLWQTKPREKLRRIFYYGYHNDDPKQMFRSSLPVGRVLEDYHDLPPVILCYKLNGQWLTPERGGPVRVVVPEAYGFKSIKWLTRILLTNLDHANDTYAEGDNDVDSPLKTFAATLLVPAETRTGEKIPITGYAQVGISGLKKVQVWLQPDKQEWAEDDPHFQRAPWIDADILPAPTNWGGDLPDNKIPPNTHGFDKATGRPKSWPMLLSHAHWVALLPNQPAGKYTLRCRTIDSQGNGQPLPRPFRKSGHAAIEQKSIVVR